MPEVDGPDLEQHRGRLFGLAYRMLGSVADAEDAVQDAFARYAASDGVDDPAGWLTRVVANQCIDQLRSARRRRETYVGPWLPEPLLTDDVDPADLAGTADSLTFAFLVVLERLSPAERAVFLLHDVFGYPHEHIAEMLDRSHAAVRQLATRARRRLADDAPRYPDEPAHRRAVTAAFLDAAQGGDLERLLQLLAPDVVLTADGGGAVSAARRPVVGAERVARFFGGLVRRAVDDEWAAAPTEVNGGPGIVVRHRGAVAAVFVFHVVEGRITAVHAIRNPEKLAHVGPVAGGTIAEQG